MIHKIVDIIDEYPILVFLTVVAIIFGIVYVKCYDKDSSSNELIKRIDDLESRIQKLESNTIKIENLNISDNIKELPV